LSKIPIIFSELSVPSNISECSRQSFDIIPKTLNAVDRDEGKSISSPFLCHAYLTLGVSEK
jgi:hypothetical protein